MIKKYLLLAVIQTIFETEAIILWLTKDNIFYFSYIGFSLSLGLSLYIKKSKCPASKTASGWNVYVLYLGLVCNENMQIEGFWYYLFIGIFEAATIVAKIFGPLIFGRGWCGYACWTAMVLDFLPYKVPQYPRKKIMFWAFIIGNLLYYTVGIYLAFLFKDNRAFCKCICPLTVFLKPMSYELFFPVKNKM